MLSKNRWERPDWASCCQRENSFLERWVRHQEGTGNGPDPGEIWAYGEGITNIHAPVGSKGSIKDHKSHLEIQLMILRKGFLNVLKKKCLHSECRKYLDKPQKYQGSLFTYLNSTKKLYLVFNRTLHFKYELHLAALKTKFEVNHYG